MKIANRVQGQLQPSRDQNNKTKTLERDRVEQADHTLVTERQEQPKE